MNAPFVWIFLPVLLAGLLTIFSDLKRPVRWGGVGSAAVFAVLAKMVPIGSRVPFAFWEVTISPQLTFFGRRFVLSEGDRPLLFLFFVMLTFWFLLGTEGSVPSRLYPLGLTATSLVITGYAVEPVFYAAIFFGFTAIACVILLTPSDTPPTNGVLRFLTYQVLGMICILFAAWLLSWIDADTVGTMLLNRTMVLMGVGFSFLLGIFPFTSWISMISEENHPYLTGFVFFIYLHGVLLFALKYLSQVTWVTDSLDIIQPTQTVGLLMIVIGGLSAVFITHLGRMLGAVVIVGVGRSLVAFSLLPAGSGFYFSIMALQGLALALGAYALHTYQSSRKDLTYPSLAGVAGSFPVHSVGLYTGLLTLAGLPFLGGFPLHWAVAEHLVNDGLGTALWFLAGNIGLLVGSLRVLSVTIKGREAARRRVLSTPVEFVIVCGCALLVLAGLLPHLLLQWVMPMAGVFQ